MILITTVQFNKVDITGPLNKKVAKFKKQASVDGYKQARSKGRADQAVGFFFSSSRISFSSTSVCEGAVAGGTFFFSRLLKPFTIRKRMKAMMTNLITAARNDPYFTAPQAS